MYSGDMPAPRHLFADWDVIRSRFSRASRVALFLDFDGTLAPIRSRPESVSLAGSVRNLLKRITQSGACVAVITGRGLADVRRRVNLGGVWYAGSHGYFLLDPKGRRYSLLTKQQHTNIQSVLRSIRPALCSIPGIQIEPKDATISVHYRRAKPSAVRSALVLVHQAVKSNRGLKLMHGKKIWEILPAARVNKWTAARFILRKQFSSRRGLLLFYLGDDTTDEAVFRKMKGISVVVGKKKATAARYFLRSHLEVKQFLRRWPQLMS
jgi:trehalose-phosphatase